jgi:hypothetical protein
MTGNTKTRNNRVYKSELSNGHNGLKKTKSSKPAEEDAWDADIPFPSISFFLNSSPCYLFTQPKTKSTDLSLFTDFPVWTSILLVCCCATISFVPSINGDFVFDDSEAVINNEDVRLTTPMWSAFYNDYWGTKLSHPNSHKSYRPLTVLSFRLDSQNSMKFIVHNNT